MYGVLAEDSSDCGVLQTMIRRLASDMSLKIQVAGFGGCGELLKNGARRVRLFSERKCQRFVVCHDSDGKDAEAQRQRIIDQVIRPSGVNATFCALVPVTEIEAWLLADLDAVKAIFTGWQRTPDISNPENMARPKEHLTRATRAANHRPRYVNSIHNAQIAERLDLGKVLQRCPSFRPLHTLVKDGKGNC